MEVMVLVELFIRNSSLAGMHAFVSEFVLSVVGLVLLLLYLFLCSVPFTNNMYCTSSSMKLDEGCGMYAGPYIVIYNVPVMAAIDQTCLQAVVRVCYVQVSAFV